MTRILVVEDNADLAAGLEHNLRLEGYDVCIAGDGSAGIAAVEAERPDLMILDLMLPGRVDGYGVLRAVRSSGGAAPSPRATTC